MKVCSHSCSLSCAILLPSVKFEELFSLKYILLISYVKILIDILVINTLTWLTIVHADRGIMTTNNTKSGREADIREEKQLTRILVVCIVENVRKQRKKRTDQEQY